MGDLKRNVLQSEAVERGADLHELMTRTRQALLAEGWMVEDESLLRLEFCREAC